MNKDRPNTNSVRVLSYDAKQFVLIVSSPSVTCTPGLPLRKPLSLDRPTCHEQMLIEIRVLGPRGISGPPQ